MFKLTAKYTTIAYGKQRADLGNEFDFETNPRLLRAVVGHISMWLFAVSLTFLAGCPANNPTENHVVGAASNSAKAIDQNVLIAQIDKTLNDNLQNRQLSTDVHGAWQILHGVLAYGREFTIESSQGHVNAVEYILAGGAIKGFDLRSGDRFPALPGAQDDPLHTRGIRVDLDPGTKVGEGHRDQWLAYLAACELSLDQEIRTADGPRTIDLWRQQIKWDVPLNFEHEFSWTLMSLVPYGRTSDRWTARDGQDYSIESLLRSEIDRLSPESACGGSHRLVGIAITLNKRKAEGLPITGVWEDAQTLVDSAIQESLDFQNEDGTFSSHYFERPGWSIEITSAIGTTGHTLEFIAVAGSDDVIKDQHVFAAAQSLCRLLDQSAEADLECGALYHALSGLRIYRQRLSAATAST